MSLFFDTLNEQASDEGAGSKQSMRKSSMPGLGCDARLCVNFGATAATKWSMKVGRRLFLAATFLTAFCVGFSPAAESKEKIILNTAFGPPISSPKGDGFFDLLMNEAFGQHGFTVSVDRPPAERALINANAGIVDGDGPRIAHLDSSGPYPDLIRVPEKIIDIEFAAFTNGKKPEINQWDDLKDYNVGIIRGWKILEREIVQSRSLVRIKTADLLFRMLMNGRVDVVVAHRLSGLAIAEKLNMKNLIELEPLLAIRPMYLYLHRKHSDLVPKISKTLARLRTDGTYARLLQKSVNAYLSKRGPNQ